MLGFLFGGTFTARLVWCAGAAVVVIGLGSWAIYAIRDSGRQAERAERAIEGGKRQTTSDTNAEAARRLSEQERCRIMAKQSGQDEKTCEP